MGRVLALLLLTGCFSEGPEGIKVSPVSPWGRVTPLTDADEIEMLEQHERLLLPAAAYEATEDGSSPLVPTVRDILAPDAPAKPIYPDPVLTPGAVSPTCSLHAVCVPGLIRQEKEVHELAQKRIYKRYSIRPDLRPAYQVDRLIPFGLCGANKDSNLWPQAYLPYPGVNEKDVCESWLHQQVCAATPKMSLQDAQNMIRTDWYKCYLRAKGK